MLQIIIYGASIFVLFNSFASCPLIVSVDTMHSMAMHHRKISCSLEARRRTMCGAGRSIERSEEGRSDDEKRKDPGFVGTHIYWDYL